MRALCHDPPQMRNLEFVLIRAKDVVRPHAVYRNHDERALRDSAAQGLERVGERHQLAEHVVELARPSLQGGERAGVRVEE